MFAKLSLLAAILPLVAALTLDTPSNVQSNGQITITFDGSGTDPLFSLELVNKIFNNAFAVANNIQPTSGSVTFTMPTVPAGDGYTLEAVNVSDINTVFATSGGFSVSSLSTSSTSASSTLGTSSSTFASGASTSGTSSTVVVTKLSSSTTPLGTTHSASSTTVATGSSATGSGTSSAAGATGSSFNSGAVAVHFGNAGTLAVGALAAVAGFAVVAF